MYGCSNDCLTLIPFRTPQITCLTLSLKCFSSDSDNCPDTGIGPCFSFPLAEGRSSPTNTPVFPPSSFVLPSFAVVLYILFYWSGTPVCFQLMFCTSVSEGVFLVYLWREMYCSSTYSSAILFSF